MFDVNRTVRLIKGALLEPKPTWQAYLSDSDDWRETAKDLTLPLIVGTLNLVASLAGCVYMALFWSGSAIARARHGRSKQGRRESRRAAARTA